MPIRDGKDALIVNWLEIEIVDAAGKTTYRNSFVTDLAVSRDNVAELAACGRARLTHRLPGQIQIHRGH